MPLHEFFDSLKDRQQEHRLRLSRMALPRTICIVIALMALGSLTMVPKLVGADSGAPLPPMTNTCLSADQVVDNLVRKNQQRAQALLHLEGTRVYHLDYRGFPGDRYAEM